MCSGSLCVCCPCCNLAASPPLEMLAWDDKIISVAGRRIDEMYILSVVRSAPIVGYLSPSEICESCVLLQARKLDMEMSPDTLSESLFVY